MLSCRSRLAISVICLGLTACSTMSPKECQFADWRAIGLTDGMAGKPLTHFDDRRSDCAEANVQADTKAYLHGREQGLKSYCQLGNAAQLGLRGETYEGVCPAGIDKEFRRRYRIGADIRRFNTEIARLNERLDALERQLRRNRHDFDHRLESPNKHGELQRIYREYERDQSQIREEHGAILNSLHWNQEQMRNAEAMLDKLPQ